MLVIKSSRLMTTLLLLFVSYGAKADGFGPTQAVNGLFNQEQDLLIANFDSKPDPDDLQAVAALGTMLQHESLSNVNYLAVAGAYGVQDGSYIPSPKLFKLAFGKRWVDAHGDREAAVQAASELAQKTLQQGGDVWLQEAGQSDFSAALVKSIRAALPKLNSKQRIHTVQHSTWNENATTPEDLLYVREYTDYSKIPDGNGGGNGTPSFNNKDGQWWSRLAEHKALAPLWIEAKRLSDENNGHAGYDNPTIAVGGFDFSDTVEATWIFGFNQLETTDDFFKKFAAH
ncbi:hypothetical protein [Gilvimarinus agarilyticus]|uniref:hypothetical protein n=1 Tax=Gilvimarinus agarilyticus TaxID=679259 RepID=UPI0005A03CEB|nr:hypothetical protein [Gilvimarinus agarilyticus]